MEMVVRGALLNRRRLKSKEVECVGEGLDEQLFVEERSSKSVEKLSKTMLRAWSV